MSESFFFYKSEVNKKGSIYTFLFMMLHAGDVMGYLKACVDGWCGYYLLNANVVVYCHFFWFTFTLHYWRYIPYRLSCDLNQLICSLGKNDAFLEPLNLTLRFTLRLISGKWVVSIFLLLFSVLMNDRRPRNTFSREWGVSRGKLMETKSKQL